MIKLSDLLGAAAIALTYYALTLMLFGAFGS